MLDTWYNFEEKDQVPGRTLLEKEKTFKTVIKIFNTLLLKTIVETGQTIRLPQRTGYLGVKKSSSYRPSKIDFDHLRKTGEVIKWSNAHTDFQHAAFYYDRPYGTVPNRAMFKFNPVKHARKKLGSSLVEDPDLINNYHE